MNVEQFRHYRFLIENKGECSHNILCTNNILCTKCLVKEADSLCKKTYAYIEAKKIVEELSEEDKLELLVGDLT